MWIGGHYLLPIMEFPYDGPHTLHIKLCAIGCMWVGCEEECYRFILRPHLCVYHFQYICFILKGICGGAGFGSGHKTRIQTG